MFRSNFCVDKCLIWETGNGVATPGHTWAWAHVKFPGVQVKLMWKPIVKDQLLACAIKFLCGHEVHEHTGKTERMKTFLWS